MMVAQAERKAYRAIIATVAERAKTALPQSNGRVDKAVQIVLNGDVEPIADGQFNVASQSDATMTYRIVSGTCSCPDAQHRAPDGACKHIISTWLYRKAQVHQSTSTGQGNSLQSVATLSLPEAPCSVNCYLDIAGRKVQVTLRGTDETQVLQRLEALLTRFPAEDEANTREQSTSWCGKHSVVMRQHKNARGTWHSHMTADGSWCTGNQ